MWFNVIFLVFEPLIFLLFFSNIFYYVFLILRSADESSLFHEPSKEPTPPKGRSDWRLTYTFVDWAPYIDSDFHVVNRGETFVRRIRSLTPSLTTALKLLIAFRLIPAVWLHITDCDETYNYWDPACL